MTQGGDLPAALAPHSATAEETLKRHLDEASSSGIPLYRMMQYQLGWVDRDGNPVPNNEPHRTYGALALLSATSFAEPAPYFGNVAAAVELFRESTAVHEQMQNGDSGSEEHPPVWWIWGPAQAINVGDGLHALARLATLKCQSLGLSADGTVAAMAGLDDLALRYYEGQYNELTYQERVDITTAQYSGMAQAKAGSLLGGAIAVGARVAGCDDATVGTLRQIGSTLGEAAQIGADVAALWSDGAVDGRVLNKSKLFPAVLVLEQGAIAEKRALGAVYFKRVMEPGDVPELQRILEAAGARERSLERRQTLIDQALASLDSLPLSETLKQTWRDVVVALS